MIEIAIITFSAAVIYAIGCRLIDWYHTVKAQMEEDHEHENSDRS